MTGFLEGKTFWVYIVIFFGKIIEVTISTIRMVLINRGERTKGSILAFFEIVLWIYIASAVIIGIRDDVIKALVYSLAFAIGNYIGSWLENKLAFGLSTIHVITEDNECAKNLIDFLRKNNLAVTVTEGEGKEGMKKILLIHLKRNRIAGTVKLINDVNNKCVIAVSDLKVIRGGFIKK